MNRHAPFIGRSIQVVNLIKFAKTFVFLFVCLITLHVSVSEFKTFLKSMIVFLHKLYLYSMCSCITCVFIYVLFMIFFKYKSFYFYKNKLQKYLKYEIYIIYSHALGSTILRMLLYICSKQIGICW